ncbi:MAG: glycosyltransferase family 39 protein [Candidatus Nealsonbacteria bacterium]|nr:glycosyltransferase family 39 protein [Candidatus Nealsonbacteria bacterium]
MKNKRTILLLLAIIAIAGFFRLWQLGTIPPGVYPDEAMNANDALTSPGKLFYPDNNGREGLFINLIALSFSVFGVSIWSLKIISAIAGILTVAGLYLLAKEMFWDKREAEAIALLSSFFLAISFWHVNFSRISFRAILVPLVMTFAFYFLLKGFRTEKIKNFIFGGLIFGLGFHTYISFRLAILLLPVLFLSYFNKQKFFAGSAVFLIFIFLAALPMGVYFLQNPEFLFSRTGGVSVFSQDNPVLEFIKSFAAHAAMFNFQGDGNWRHNFADSPQLFWPVGILFLVGVAISIRKMASSTAPLLLLAWLFVMLLPGALTYEGIPHALRTIGAIPPAYILAGFGGWRAYQFASEKVGNKKLLFVGCLFLLFSLAYAQFSRYFFIWAQRPEVQGAFNVNYNEIGHYLNSLPEGTKKYVIVNEFGSPLHGISIPGQTPMFIERTKFGKLRANYLAAERLNEIDGAGNTVIVPLYFEDNLRNELERKFPQGRIENKKFFNAYIID